MLHMNITEINTGIITGLFDNDLNSIIEAIKYRREQKAVAVKNTLKPGDPVRLIGTIRPTYLAFATAKVVKVNVKKIVIDLDRLVRRFFKNVVVPVNLIEKV